MTKRDRLRKALRGGFGYATQQEAWDSVLPDWRRLLAMVNGIDGRKLTPKDRADLDAFSAALEADGHFLARCWYQLLMQSLYRRCPALGGWFPK